MGFLPARESLAVLEVLVIGPGAVSLVYVITHGAFVSPDDYVVIV